jgi:chorismate mutase/prephenate dehydrogenase
MSAQRSETTRLEQLRGDIERVDEALIETLARRLELAAEIGRIKEHLGLPVMDPAREAEVVRRAAALARDRGVDPELARDVFWRVIAQARVVQHRRNSGGSGTSAGRT